MGLNPGSHSDHGEFQSNSGAWSPTHRDSDELFGMGPASLFVSTPHVSLKKSRVGFPVQSLLQVPVACFLMSASGFQDTVCPVAPQKASSAPLGIPIKDHLQQASHCSSVLGDKGFQDKEIPAISLALPAPPTQPLSFLLALSLSRTTPDSPSPLSFLLNS